jgi:CHAT domain-containing protein/tetratricopeptide (TPR) repeat protein
MKRFLQGFIILFFLFFFGSTSLAQDKAIKILYQRLKDPLISIENTAQTYRQLTRLYAKQHNYLAALEAAQKEANIQRRIKGKEKLAEVYFNIASLHRTLVAYSEALTWGKKALTIYAKTLGKNHIESLNLCRFLAETYYLQEDYEAATQLSLQTIQICQKKSKKEPSIVIKLQILLGSIYVKLGQYNQGQRNFIAAKKLYEQFESSLSKDLLPRIYNNLAALKLQQHAILEALAYYQKIATLRKVLRHENHFSLHTTYTNIGTCYYRLDNFQKALSYHYKALNILKNTYQQKHPLIASSHNYIGGIFQYMEEADSAYAHLQKSTKIYQELFGVNHPKTIAPLWRLAKLHRQQKAYQESEQVLKKTIALQEKHFGLKHPDLAKMYLDMAYLFQAQNLPVQANYYTKKAYQSNLLKKHPLDQLLMLGIIEHQLHLSLDLKLQEQEKIFLRLDEIQPIVALTQTNVRYLTDKQNLIQQLRKVCERGIELCYQLYQQKPNQAYLDKAFELMEYNKAVLLSIQIKQDHWQDKHTDSTYATQEQSLAKIHFLEQKWKKAEQEQNAIVAAQLQQELFGAHKSYEQDQDKTYRPLQYHRPIDLALLQKQLTAEQSIINYFYGENYIYIFNIQAKQTQLLQVGLEFKEDIAQFSKYLLNLEESKLKLASSCQQFDQAALTLYQTLIPSPANSELLIIPDGQLSYLPFETLTTQAFPEASGYHQLHYALYQHTISYAYSATSYYYQQYQHQNQENSQILGFAPSYENNVKLPALKANIQEVAFLEKEFSGAYYYNQEASKKAFQEQSNHFSILHLASHGYADNHELQQAKLFFAQEAGDSFSATLHPHEIVQLPLHADFVVLSACKTAIGFWQKGEGIMSLARDFMYSGVPSILTTLWQINDQSSSRIIQDFYHELQNTPKHKALQLAKQHYLEQASAFRAHPYFWSGYILVGNTNRLDIARPFYGKIWYICGLSLFLLVTILFLRRTRRTLK